MLEIANVSWQNFLSYGDYITTLNIAGLGQCLITGEVLDDEDKEAYDVAPLGRKRKSNGAGKSSCTAALQWTLFNRTMHAASPGDKVINWFTGKNCWGKIEFKSGDSIVRTRNTDGCDEVLICRNGDETKLVANTISTSKNQQAVLARQFELDWDLFCGSTFFSQYNKPWMQMADQPRKRAFERLLHVDRYAYYAKVAKAKCEALDQSVQKANDRKANLEREVSRLTAEIERLTAAADSFQSRLQTKYANALAAIKEEEQRRTELIVPDIEKLKAKWAIVTQIQAKITTNKADAEPFLLKANSLNNTISKHEANANALQGKIKLWREKDGKVCMACEQTVPHEHVGSRVEPLEQQISAERVTVQKLKNEQIELRAKHEEAMVAVRAMEQILAQKKPTTTVKEAQNLETQRQQFDKNLARMRVQAEEILKEENPHLISMAASRERIVLCNAELATVAAEINRFEFLNKHYYYTHKAYLDRDKIKSFIFKEHLPFINNRLRHYLDVFGLDIRLELTDSLGIASNMWGYEFESGGEQKRTDVAFMLATYDFHEHMYGRQSNVLVLDEVDGRLDDDGIDSLINIIKSDLAARVETILIISHKSHMQDVFPREIKVQRRNRFSTLEVV